MKSLVKIFVMISGFTILLVTPGCDKFLQKDLQGELTQENFPVTASDALLATNAAYETLRDWFYNWGGYPILDIMSDDAVKGSNPTDQVNNVGPYNNFTFTPGQQCRTL